MACNPLIRDDFVFPRRAANLPALPRIAFRIGRQADFLEAMRRTIDAAPELAGWTHRHADDPAIALLEGAAILGDILSFYQEHYANEAYLRTATWRESVAELVRLTGYRLAPGLGGRATLAFEVRGSTAVTLRAGLPVKLQTEGAAAPADFETDAELLAWPHLGRFRLYAPRTWGSAIDAGSSMVELDTVAGAADAASLSAIDFKPGDRLLLVPDESKWSAGGDAAAVQATPQMVSVVKATRQLDRVLLELDPPLVADWTTPVRAWRLGRTLRHFGHNAPRQLVRPVVDAATLEIAASTAEDTAFHRVSATGAVYGVTSAAAPYYSVLAAGEIPLDLELADFAAGGTVIVQGLVETQVQPVPTPFIVTRSVRDVRAGALQWGNLAGGSTRVTLDGALVQNPWLADAVFDIRELRLHETRGPALTLRPLPVPAAGDFAGGDQALLFFGTAAQAQALAGRRLHLSHADGRSAELVCTNAAADFVPATPDQARTWALSFDRAPAPLRLEDFDEALPTVDVFGNLVDASQGRSERSTVLGNGDPRRAFQTFALPKTPLTYLLDPAATPPQVPQLEIQVGGRVWSRVDAFFGHGADETVYVVREDAEGRSFVQFGDGITGARLPSGVKNVSAVYRSGSGARGAPKAGTAPTAGERPPGLDKVSLAGVVSGGADPETVAGARETAPQRVQALGRLVALADYESAARAIPGVLAVGVRWDLHHGLPVVLLRVLLESGREAEFAAVQAALVQADACTGPGRHTLVVEQALLRHVWLDLQYGRDPGFDAATVAAAVTAALGLAGVAADERSGLFGARARALGQPEYASRIEGRVQNVPGVAWCRVTALGLLAPGLADPAAEPLPHAPRALAATLPCAPHELLQLAAAHLTLTEAGLPTGPCAP